MTAQLDITLDQSAYAPGETLTGTVRWNNPENPRKLTLVVGWYTSGKGSTDSKIEFEEYWPTSELTGSKRFEFELPPSPYSFAGTLIELTWYVEARLEVRKVRKRTHFNLAPNRELVRL